MSDIVLGYDGSGCGGAALQQAISLAKELNDRIVIVFGYAPGGYGGGEVPTQRQAVKELGEQATAEAAKAATDAGVDHEVELVNEHGAAALIDVADRHDARMIVVGTHGVSALKGALLGSTTHRLAQSANRPVLIVPPDRKD
jgi:nucleotide-binding universal stress UspA family protein